MSPFVEPFNEAKYKALMDGLECKEINIKEVDKKLFRIEPEYFQKKYLIAEQILSKYDLFNASKIECGPFGSNLLDTNYQSDGVLVVRPFNLIDMTIENDRLVYVDEALIQKNNLKTYGKGYVLFSRVGDIKIGYSNKTYYTISPNIVIADVKDDRIAKYYSIFFNTYYGKIQIQRQLKVSAQPTISTEIISKLKVPFFRDLFNYVVLCVTKAEKNLEIARKIYEFEENKLSSIISVNLETTSNISVKNTFASFSVSGRLDAEYYQPKYDALFAALSKFKTKKLGGAHGLVSIAKSIEPGSEAYVDEGIPFVRVSDISKFEISKPEIKLCNDVVDTPELFFPKKDTVLLSKDGSVGIAYKVDEDMKVITSSALLHLTVLNPAEVLPDYLTLVLNSPIVQLQAERDCNGAIIQHWKPSEIENVIIPILDMDTQKEISAKVQESFALRKQSKLLLEYAKQAVEMAIEQGEDKALEWLKDKVN